jgi:hypothetical protein
MLTKLIQAAELILGDHYFLNTTHAPLEVVLEEINEDSVSIVICSSAQRVVTARRLLCVYSDSNVPTGIGILPTGT